MNYIPENVEVLKMIINQYEAISFDVWDTLITRTVLEPEDIFSIVENRAKIMKLDISNFRAHRHEAIFNVECGNPNITEVYDALQRATGISDKEKEILLQLEIQIESEMIVPREEMVQIFNYTISIGKQVNLVSDMYIPGSIMENLLKKAGVVGYDNLFVSCDYRQLKIGTLFQIYKEKIHAKNYLHIGDNPVSDIAEAAKWGLDTVKIKSGYELLKESSFSKLIDIEKTYNESCMVGLFCARIFNSPFVKGKKIKILSCKDLGWLFIAPIISEFMLWLRSEILQGSYEGILFAARDGYLFQRLYFQMQSMFLEDKLPKGIYFLTSRALCTQASIQDEEDIKWLSLVKFNGTREELLHFRFYLDILESNGSNLQDDRNILEYVLLHKDRILDKAKETRDNYLNYMKKIGMLPGEKYVFFDFVSSGTCQNFLEKFIPFKLEGKYFCHSITPDERAQLEISSLYVNDGVEKADSYLYKNYRYLETIITSPMPSLLYIDKDLRCIYNEEIRSGEELNYIKEIQETIEDYFTYFIKMCDKNEKSDIRVAELMYQFMGEEYIEMECKGLNGMKLWDDWVREMAEK